MAFWFFIKRYFFKKPLKWGEEDDLNYGFKDLPYKEGK